ncbi:TPA: pilus assembly protein, partial [Escherichia coli]|nr:pilus assembly protein [Escherichia coli]
TVSEVMSIVSAVNGLYVGTSNYANLTKDVIMNTSAIPENYKDSKNKNIMHPFGGTIDLGATKDNSKYFIILNEVPQGACVNLASMNLGTSLAGVGVGVDVAKATSGNVSGTGTGSLKNKALTPAEASSACGKNSNQIAFLLK